MWNRTYSPVKKTKIELTNDFAILHRYTNHMSITGTVNGMGKHITVSPPERKPWTSSWSKVFFFCVLARLSFCGTPDRARSEKRSCYQPPKWPPTLLPPHEKLSNKPFPPKSKGRNNKVEGRGQKANYWSQQYWLQQLLEKTLPKKDSGNKK